MIALIALFVAITLIMYLLSEVNQTFSSYGIRRYKTQSDYENSRYYSWFIEKEPYLEDLYDQEYCEEMTLSFEEFCWAIYDELEIIYV